MRYRDFGVLAFDEAKATPGYTLITPLAGRAAYLLGMRGEVLHQWGLPLTPGDYAYLLENGNLLWAGRTADGPPLQAGKGGLLREYDWDGNVVWEHRDDAQHHDFRRRPGGNTIYLGWEMMRPETAARVRGGLPGTERDAGVIWSDYVREVDRTGATVWEWHMQDDLEIERYPLNPVVHRDEFAHANACCPLANGGVMLGFRRINTILIVDRATRRVSWEHRDESWGLPHDAEMLANGHITLFANGINTGQGQLASRVVEIDRVTRDTVWEYRGDPPWTLFSSHVSGAQRLWSRNTLICEGQWGRVFEVTPEKEIVWEYVSPFFGSGDNGARSNSLFRAYRYAPDSPQIRDRIRSI